MFLIVPVYWKRTIACKFVQHLSTSHSKRREKEQAQSTLQYFTGNHLKELNLYNQLCFLH